MENTKIEGLIAATVTPMDHTGEVNLSSLDRYADYLVKIGVKGVFINGTTGESLFLEKDERKRLAEAWMRHADRLKILVHVGSTSVRTAADLAAHAQQLGVHAISSMGPCFLQPKRTEELVAFNQQIAAQAPDIPYYYYHIPVTSGVHVNMPEFLSVAKDRIPNLRGIKYTSFDSMEMQECIDYENRSFDILHGHDESILTGLVLGATGAIGTSYNLSAPLFNDILNAFYAGDIRKAADVQARGVEFIRLMLRYVNAVVSVKAMLNIIGIDCGPCRLPLQNLSTEEMKALEKDMKAFDWIQPI